jgi:hypothetical protein
VAWSSGTATRKSDAGDPAGNSWTGESNTNDKTFRVFLLACLGLSGGVRVQEKSSVPRSRLAYIHLQASI